MPGRPNMRRALALLLVALATGALAPAAGAAARSAAPAPAAIGISDQTASTFADPLFQSLGMRHARLVTPWNSVYTQPAELARWIGATQAAGIEPLVAFNHALDDRCPASPCRLPSVGQYRRAFAKFRRLHPTVRAFQPWNEANHQSQPTGRNPRRAAQYYNAIRSRCRGCTIVAADVLDSNNMERWLRSFKRVAKRPRLWGLHNYTDTNRFRTSGTERLLETVDGEVWLTETGGVVRFETSDGRVSFPNNPRRAARALRHMFRIAATYPDRIRRVYIYQWKKTNSFDRFDAGLVDPRGRPRPSYRVVRDLIGGGAKPLRPKRDGSKPAKPGKPGQPQQQPQRPGNRGKPGKPGRR